VPSSWFCTTSTVCSSVTLRPCCMPLPIMGFTAFLPVAKQGSPPCVCCPSKLSLRRQLRRTGTNPSPPRARVTVSTVSGRHVHREPCLPVLSLSSVLRDRFPLRFPAAGRADLSIGRSHRPDESVDPKALLHRRVRCACGRCRPTAPGAPLGLAGSPIRATFRFRSPQAGGPRTGPACTGSSGREDHTNERPTSRQRPLRRAFPSV
jgi:hypothetical protein